MKDKPHPWGIYLQARADLIDWYKEEYNASDAEIAEKFKNVDEMQIYLIRTRDRSLAIYPRLKITIEPSGNSRWLQNDTDSTDTNISVKKGII